MKVNVIDFASPGHFTLVDSVVRIFSSKESISVTIYLDKKKLPYGRKLISGLHRKNISVFLYQDSKSIAAADLSIIVTPDQQLSAIKEICNLQKSWLFIHNIDDWFEISLSSVISKCWDSISRNRNYRLAYFFLKRYVKETYLRKALIQLTLLKGQKFLVLNLKLKENLSRFIPESEIFVIPFSVYDPLIPIATDPKILRICVPGIISQLRRDYLALLEMLDGLEDFKQGICIDLLGALPVTERQSSAIIKDKVERLSKRGYNILLRETTFIDPDEFDAELGKADFILGNLKISQEGSSAYGITKESGVPFTMIRSGKPGILPFGYETMPELKDSTIRFSDYQNLARIIRHLIIDPSQIHDFKNNANLASQTFRDDVILERILLQTNLIPSV